MKNKKLSWKKALLMVLVTIVCSLMIEIVICNFNTFRYKEDPIQITCQNNNKDVFVSSDETLVELSEDEKNSIIVERDNAKLLAEYNGVAYVQKPDETLVEKDGTMYRKIIQTTIKVVLPKEYYVHKFRLDAGFTEKSGYHLATYLDNQKIKEGIYASVDPKIGMGVATVDARCDQLEIVLLSNLEVRDSKVVETLLPEITATVSNQFHFNFYRFLLMTMSILLLVTIFFQSSFLEERPEWLFVCVSFVLGGLLILGIGTNQVSYDEHVHEKAAYELSYLSTIETTESVMQMEGSNLPLFTSVEERALVEAYEQKNHDYSWADISTQSIIPRAESRVYYPMAAGFFLARLLNFSFANSLALAKLGNLLLYIILVFWSIKLASRYKMLVVTIGLLPNAIFLASSITYDIVVNGFLMLGTVLLFNELLEPEKKLKWNYALAILLCYVIGSLSKPIYIAMAFMLLFFGKKKFENRLQELVFKVAFLALAAFMILNIFHPTPLAGGEKIVADSLKYAGDKRNPGTSQSGQIQFIMSQPFHFVKILLSSMFGMLFDYLRGKTSYIGYAYLGNVHFLWSWVVILLAFFGSVFVPKEQEQKTIAWPYRILTMLMIFGTSALVWSSLYVVFTAVGKEGIDGVQGRYFIPLFFPFFLCFGNKKWKCKLSKANYQKIFFFVMTTLNLYMTYQFILVKNL